MSDVIEKGPDEEEDDTEDNRPTQPVPQPAEATPDPAEATPLPTSRPSRPGRRGADDTGDWVVVVDRKPDQTRSEASAPATTVLLDMSGVVSARHR